MSSTQSVVSLSSGEAEYYGFVRASGVGLGYQSLLADLGLKLPLRAWTDSTVSIGICSRSGLGKLRHIDTQCLRLQHKVRSKAVGTSTANFLAADRPETLFASKEIRRWMSEPTELSLDALEGLGRFLEGHRRLVYTYPWQPADTIEAYSESGTYL